MSCKCLTEGDIPASDATINFSLGSSSPINISLGRNEGAPKIKKIWFTDMEGLRIGPYEVRISNFCSCPNPLEPFIEGQTDYLLKKSDFSSPDSTPPGSPINEVPRLSDVSKEPKTKNGLSLLKHSDTKKPIVIPKSGFWIKSAKLITENVLLTLYTDKHANCGTVRKSLFFTSGETFCGPFNITIKTVFWSQPKASELSPEIGIQFEADSISEAESIILSALFCRTQFIREKMWLTDTTNNKEYGPFDVIKEYNDSKLDKASELITPPIESPKLIKSLNVVTETPEISASVEVPNKPSIKELVESPVESPVDILVEESIDAASDKASVKASVDISVESSNERPGEASVKASVESLDKVSESVKQSEPIVVSESVEFTKSSTVNVSKPSGKVSRSRLGSHKLARLRSTSSSKSNISTMSAELEFDVIELTVYSDQQAKCGVKNKSNIFITDNEYVQYGPFKMVKYIKFRVKNKSSHIDELKIFINTGKSLNFIVTYHMYNV